KSKDLDAKFAKRNAKFRHGLRGETWLPSRPLRQGFSGCSLLRISKMRRQTITLREGSMPTLRLKIWPFLLCPILVFTASALAQTRPSTPKKLLTFDVVSIRPSHSQEGAGVKILPDGYQAKGMSLATTILIAYFPAPYFKHQDELKGYPSWVANETYEIEAKVSPADLAEWQRLNQNMMQTSEVLQRMLRAVLAERCKLVIHSMSAQVDG